MAMFLILFVLHLEPVQGWTIPNVSSKRYRLGNHPETQGGREWTESWALSSTGFSGLDGGSSATTTSSSSMTGAAVESRQHVIQSSILGRIAPIELEGDEDGSFLKEMAVPTFAADIDSDEMHHANNIAQDFVHTKSGGLDGILGQGPALMVHNVLSPDMCNELIGLTEQLGFGSFQAGRNHHGALQIVVSKAITDAIGQVLSRHIDLGQVNERRIEMEQQEQQQEQEDVRLVFAGLNRRWRVYRYAPGKSETFAPHIDAGFPPSGLTPDGRKLVWNENENTDSTAANDKTEVVSRLTVLMYLNDDFHGGETNFFRPLSETPPSQSDLSLLASVRPKQGSVLIFPQAVGQDATDYARQHWPLHEGAPVSSGTRPKYIIRSDVLFATEREPLPLDDALFRHDHQVRDAFMPRSPAYDPVFLQHLSSLYNPHMGVENLGPLLYSLIRFVKVKRIVEIGAGYTSPWILQALKDNDDDMARIQKLTDQGQCRLLDIEWTVPPLDETATSLPSSLLCIDNCEHQKETATGALAVAKALGLEEYMEFMKADAFDLDLDPESIDLLWCDFGVGSKMGQFAPGAWKSIRPGGFLLCHSTLTNRGTRDWLEAVRAGADESITGIPAGHALEISFLEPHKRYQNSISVLQKRRSHEPNGQAFEEPIYSQYA